MKKQACILVLKKLKSYNFHRAGEWEEIFLPTLSTDLMETENGAFQVDGSGADQAFQSPFLSPTHRRCRSSSELPADSGGSSFYMPLIFISYQGWPLGSQTLPKIFQIRAGISSLTLLHTGFCVLIMVQHVICPIPGCISLYIESHEQHVEVSFLSFVFSQECCAITYGCYA